ncbi:hypothetical protein GIB67_033493 [Kingdonia uniflora]|uniref:Uncharacterized protein n=1 Tax=Kingdonia uniflora TaxID=39325 RepID=A0A7J7L6A9_9MAGN|nr:hypothetical protein GIB67_033493 [Kingdonia uniflora]
MLNFEQEEPSHPNYNKPPYVPAKIIKTNSSRAKQVREDSASASNPQVAPREDEDLETPSTSGSPPQGDVKACTNSQGEFREDSSTHDEASGDSQAYVSSTDYFAYKEVHVSDNAQFEAFLNNPVEKKAGGPGFSLLLVKITTFAYKPKGKIFPRYLSTSPSYLVFPYLITPVVLIIVPGGLRLGRQLKELVKALKMFIEAIDNYKLEDIEGQNEDLHCLEEKIPNLKFEVNSLKSVKEVEDRARSKLLEALELKIVECDSLRDADNRLEADTKTKQVVDSICMKDYSETIKKLNGKTLEYNSLRESNEKLSEDVLENVKLENSLADLVSTILRKKCENLNAINENLMDQVAKQEPQPLPLNLVAISEGNVIGDQDWKQKYDEINVKYEDAQRKLSVRDVNCPKEEYDDNLILPGGEYNKMIDLRLKKIDCKTKLRWTLFQPFNWFQLDIRDVKRDRNIGFRVTASYTNQSQLKFMNVKQSLCTLMTKKPSSWKSMFNQRLDVAYNNLGERIYDTLLQAFNFNGVFVEYLYMGHLLATCYEKIMIFINNKEGLRLLPKQTTRLPKRRGLKTFFLIVQSIGGLGWHLMNTL